MGTKRESIGGLRIDMLGLILAGCSLQAPLAPRSGTIAAARVPALGMDETMLEKALAGELADEGQANPYMAPLQRIVPRPIPLAARASPTL